MTTKEPTRLYQLTLQIILCICGCIYYLPHDKFTIFLKFIQPKHKIPYNYKSYQRSKTYHTECYLQDCLQCKDDARMITIYILQKIIIIFNLRTAAFKANCAIWFRRSNFRHQASPRVSPCESTQRQKVELWARNVREFCVNADLHITFRDLLHAGKL